jgi:hypothetical protein
MMTEHSNFTINNECKLTERNTYICLNWQQSNQCRKEQLFSVNGFSRKEIKSERKFMEGYSSPIDKTICHGRTKTYPKAAVTGQVESKTVTDPTFFCCPTLP